MQVAQGFQNMQSLGLLGVVLDTGLNLTPLIGHLGCLASHWSVPVRGGMQRKAVHMQAHEQDPVDCPARAYLVAAKAVSF